MSVISTDSLIQIFSKCRQLRKLSLEHVPVNDAVCKALAQNRKLEVLNLAMSTGLTPYGIKKILGSLKWYEMTYSQIIFLYLQFASNHFFFVLVCIL